MSVVFCFFFFFKQKTAYEMRISDWSSDVCSSDLCVHIYGALRGRAIAGARGETSARIFCRRFEAELVAIAGVYAVAEQMQGDLRGKPAQVVQIGRAHV